MKNHIGDVKSIKFIILTNFIFLFLFISAYFTNINILDYDTSKLNGMNLKLIVMFLLAEPHFAMTIPMLWGYRSLLKSKNIIFLKIPILIILVSVSLYILSPILFSAVFLIANVYHVNRQSLGFLKLQSKGAIEYGVGYECALHIFAIIVVMNLYLNIITGLIISVVFFTIFCIIFLSIIFKAYNAKFTFQGLCSILQGFLIFFPVLVIDDLLLAFAVGISIHYVQYLFISWKLCYNSFGISALQLLIFITVYSILATGMLSINILDNSLTFLIIIPTTLQLLHFYFDSFIWRRADPLIRETLRKAKI